ncbi:hypothetical protein QAD02_008606 [Eretmocerus hayati]|uniref:Uncharacterized protein n=1 Tax=Eretmocerus hayati TaxID=131215 RepID=A0ACC2N7B0_9HYME|nr:hypothetical protein QAD02_008606 [Eretmocerus hayati]
MFSGVLSCEPVEEKMVQKDDRVNLIFHYKSPSSHEILRKNKNLPKAKGTVLSEIISGLGEITRDLCKYNHSIDLCSVNFRNYEETQEGLRININNPLQEFDSFLNNRNMEGMTMEIFLESSQVLNDPKEQLDTSSTPSLALETNHQDYEQRSEQIIFGSSAAKMRHHDENHDSENSDGRNHSNDEDLSEPRYVGLVNQAMTCYLNSLLQALYMTPEFRNAMYNWEYKSHEKDGTASIPYQLQKLFLNLQTSNKPAVETTSLTKSFGWDSSEAWHQHDIQELCRVMFDALEQKFKNTAQADLINRLYEGKINDYVKCLTCNTEKYREDTFLDIPLPVRPFDTNEAYGSVEEALEAFVKYELLEGTNQYFCEKCDKKSNAHKGLKFTKFPYILTLQLKRFDFDQNTYHRIKLNDKVTFPDILNLNRFIEITPDQESPSREEDAGMSIKCDDSYTTDSSTIDEDCNSCDIPTMNSNHVSYNDQDDDEGIDMSNGTSSSSTSAQYNNFIKRREEYASLKGPYVYELFSIMIHSGSASGGHYYAYIKDFRTDKWFCFNDQSVYPITHEEIQKSYGGGAKGSFYSGAYRSSTNAYMLMYRQIDPDRNTLPMKADSFPAHIQKLLEKMKEYELNHHIRDKDSCYNRTFLKPVYYRHPMDLKEDSIVDQVSVSVSLNMTLEEVTDVVYNKGIFDQWNIKREQCRIVTYIPRYDVVDRDFEQRYLRLDDLLDNQHAMKDLLLDVRLKDKFDKYSGDPIVTKVYVICCKKRTLEAEAGPRYVRGYIKQTIKEYKEELIKYFDLNPRCTKLYSPDILPGELMDDDFEFEDNLSSTYAYKVYATTNYDGEEINGENKRSFRESVFYKLATCLEDSVTFYIDSAITIQKSDFFIETNEKHDIKPPSNQSLVLYDPSYSFNHQRRIEEVDSCTSSLNLKGKRDDMKSASDDTCSNNPDRYSCERKKNENSARRDDGAMSDSSDAPPSVFFVERDQWSGPETSNSEDSSLSDSDRTLVGDAPEETASYQEAVESEPTTEIDSPNFCSLKNVQASLWKVTSRKGIAEEQIRMHLEPRLEIPKEYHIKILDSPADEASSYNSFREFKDDQKYSISLQRVPQSDEISVDIYSLDMWRQELVQKIFTVVLKQGLTVAKAKHEIWYQLNLNKLINEPLEELIFMHVVDGEVVDEELGHDWEELIIKDGVCIPVSSDEGYQADDGTALSKNLATYIPTRNKFVVKKMFLRTKLKKWQVQDLFDVPQEFAEYTKLYASNKYIVGRIEQLPWVSKLDLATVNRHSFVLVRDSRESPKELTEDEAKMTRTLAGPNRSRSLARSGKKSGRAKYNKPTTTTLISASPRKEKALKIHVDST